MATKSEPVGYECEFVDQVPEDFLCKKCNHVAREPNITSCCTELLCKGCVDFILLKGDPCPSCGDIQVGIHGPHKKYNHKILALEVHCAMKNRGCQWTGQLQSLGDHLHVLNDNCQYIDIDCPKQCGVKVQKHNVNIHLADHCPNRDYVCKYCNFKETFCVVSEHFEVCPYYPIACANRCGVSFERGDLDDHMRMCHLEEVQCMFSDAGCQATFVRDNEDEHMEQNTQKHLALMAATTLRISQHFEGMLQKQQQCIQHQQEAFEKQLQEKDEQIKAVQDLERKLRQQQAVYEKKLQDSNEQIQVVQDLEQKLQEQQQKFHDKQEVFEKKLQDKCEQIKTVQEEIQTTSQMLMQQPLDAVSEIRRQVGIPPYDFTLSNYQQLKTRKTSYNSPPMHTHPNGYMFELTVYPNGWPTATNVSVIVYSLKSDYDAELQFPVQFTITLRLLNQFRDQDHYTRDIQCKIEKMEVIYGEVISIGSEWTLIPKSDLEWNAEKQTQYLKDDCLRFRITKIVIQ